MRRPPRRGRDGRAAALLSGGLDSAVSALIARQENRHLMLVTFDYGQVNRRELAAARELADWLRPEAGHQIVKLDFSALAATQRSALLGAQEPSPDLGHYVPGRNIIFIAHAAALSEAADLERLYVGSNLQDAPHRSGGYPDSSSAFLEAMQKTLSQGLQLGSKLQLCSPLVRLNKFDVIRLGESRGLDLSMTWSCYSASPALACGACSACWARLLNFHWAGSCDPLRYALPIDQALENALAHSG